MRILGNPKITLRIATGTSELRMRPFLILAIFGFPLNTPLPTRHFLFRARFAARLRTRLEQIFCALLHLSERSGTLSERSGTIEVHLATLSAQNLRKIFRSMLRDYVYLIGFMPTLIIWLR